MKRILSILLALAMVFALAGCTASDYKAAVKTMESGDYAAASAAFKALGDYEDSAAQAQHCDYLLATELYNSGDYAAALAAYEALGDYEDSAQRAQEAKDLLLASKLIGQWTSSMELRDMIAAVVAAEGMDLALPSLEMVVDLEVSEDLSYRMILNEERTRESVQSFIDGFGLVMLDMIRQELAAYDLTIEDALPQLGVSTEEELAEMLLAESGLTVDDVMKDLPTDTAGTLEVSDGVIQVLADDGSYEAVYDESADTFSMIEDMSVSGFSMEYTFEFTRK